MKLVRCNLNKITAKSIALPQEEIFNYPERVLQFGTGMLLRGLPDYFIDKANREGFFKGRIVVVKSTASGDASVFKKQDGLYTICQRGVANGKNVEENIVSSAISRVLIAHDDWRSILDCARNPDLKIIISNTTEMGIQLVRDDDINSSPPVSFPGKLLAFLYERFKIFKGDKDSGFIVIPTELLPDNGGKLRSIVGELARLNRLEEAFIEWLEVANHFCSSLVDRIVTGMPSAEKRDEIFSSLGYRDDLLTVTEVYGLWAIEGDGNIKESLSFSKVNPEVKIEPDINIYRELKLRLLNATHTLSSGIAFLAQIDTVKDAMNGQEMSGFIEELMRKEIAPSIPMEIPDKVKQQFIDDVLDRFRNPHLEHHWKTIAQNISQKMKLRCLPLLVHHYKSNDAPLRLITLGFAAWIVYMRGAKEEDGKYFGRADNCFYLIDDGNAKRYYLLWKCESIEEVVKEILSDTGYWGMDLTAFPGFYTAVVAAVSAIVDSGMEYILKNKKAKETDNVP